MKNLISLREFVLLRNNKEEVSRQDFIMCRDYANFLSRQPQLSDFVACGEDGLPLEIIPFNVHRQGSNFEFLQHQKYREALDKVLFKGFEIREYADNVEFVKAIVCPNNVTHIAWYSKITCSWHLSKGITSLESLTPYNLELTDNANKIIGV